MNKSLISLIVFCLFFSMRGIAQEKGANDYDGEKHITGTDYSYYKKKEKGGNTEIKPEANVVKFSTLSWLSGCIPFYYERRVMPWLGLQGGLGLTTRDFMADVRNDLVYISNNEQTPAYNNYAFYRQQGRKSSAGFYLSFQPKFYPKKRGLGGFFVSPMVEFKRYNYRADYTDPTPINSDDQPIYLSRSMAEYRNAVDFTVNIGWQWLFHSKVSLELMMGAGFRKLWDQRRSIDQTPVQNGTGYDTYSYSTITLWTTSYRPEFNLTLNLGGYF